MCIGLVCVYVRVCMFVGVCMSVRVCVLIRAQCRMCMFLQAGIHAFSAELVSDLVLLTTNNQALTHNCLPAPTILPPTPVLRSQLCVPVSLLTGPSAPCSTLIHRSCLLYEQIMASGSLTPQVASILLPLCFAYDIFWVFIQPLLTDGKSVMVEVSPSHSPSSLILHMRTY